jgi:hypothetical protein
MMRRDHFSLAPLAMSQTSALKADQLNMIRCLDWCSDHPLSSWGKQEMTFQRIIAGVLVLLIAGLAGAFYMNWKTLGQLRTMKAFVEGYVFADAVAACEKAPSTTPFKWNSGTKTSVVGLNSVRPDKYTVVASYTLVADSVYCDYDPIKKKADIGSNFLERE